MVDIFYIGGRLRLESSCIGVNTVFCSMNHYVRWMGDTRCAYGIMVVTYL